MYICMHMYICMYMYMYILCIYIYIYIQAYIKFRISVCECLKAKNVFLREIFRGGNILTPKTFFSNFLSSQIKFNLKALNTDDFIDGLEETGLIIISQQYCSVLSVHLLHGKGGLFLAALPFDFYNIPLYICSGLIPVHFIRALSHFTLTEIRQL